MKVKILINDEEERIFLLRTEKTAKIVISTVMNNLDKDLVFVLSHDESYIIDYWYDFLIECGFLIEHKDKQLITSNRDQSKIRFILSAISLMHLKYARKTIIANTVYLSESFIEASKAVIYMIALHCSHNPKYSKIFPLCKPFDFSKRINFYIKVRTIFIEKKYDKIKLVNAINTKNLKILKKYL